MGGKLLITKQASSSNVRRKIFLQFAFACLLIFCLLLIAKAQDDVIRVQTDLVGFEVTITDQQGKPVRGLQAKDFKFSRWTFRAV
jgi:hypothetical protein